MCNIIKTWECLLFKLFKRCGQIIFITCFSVLWYLFLFMTSLHLYANYKAVKSLNFNTFNRERLLLVIQEYLSREIILPPIEINRRESVYLGFGLSGTVFLCFNFFFLSHLLILNNLIFNLFFRFKVVWF